MSDKNKKLSLDDLKVQSFVTALEEDIVDKFRGGLLNQGTRTFRDDDCASDFVSCDSCTCSPQGTGC